MSLQRNFPPLAFGREANEVDGSPHLHYVEVGKTIVKWAKDRTNWPKTVDDFEKQLKVTREPGVGDDRLMYIPKVYTKISITQAGDGQTVQPNLVSNAELSTGELKSEVLSHSVVLEGSSNNGAEFMLRLPPASQVAESEDHVAAGNSYSLPPIYTSFSTKMEIKTGGEDLLLFYARVADYTMRGCR